MRRGGFSGNPASMRTLILSFSLILCATPALAEEPAPAAAAAKPPEPKPAPELEAYMKGFEGKWKCQTTFPAGAMGPGSPEVKTTANVELKKELNGFFYRGEYKTA